MRVLLRCQQSRGDLNPDLLFEGNLFGDQGRWCSSARSVKTPPRYQLFPQLALTRPGACPCRARFSTLAFLTLINLRGEIKYKKCYCSSLSSTSLCDFMHVESYKYWLHMLDIFKYRFRLHKMRHTCGFEYSVAQERCKSAKWLTSSNKNSLLSIPPHVTRWFSTR